MAKVGYLYFTPIDSCASGLDTVIQLCPQLIYLTHLLNFLTFDSALSGKEGGNSGADFFSRLPMVNSGIEAVIPQAAIYDVILGKILISTDSMNISE